MQALSVNTERKSASAVTRIQEISSEESSDRCSLSAAVDNTECELVGTSND